MCAARMRRRRIRHLVVVEGTRLTGVVSERDLGAHAGARVREGRVVRERRRVVPRLLRTPRAASDSTDAQSSARAHLNRER